MTQYFETWALAAGTGSAVQSPEFAEAVKAALQPQVWPVLVSTAVRNRLVTSEHKTE